MGFGNSIPYVQKEPPDPTFGALRADFLGFFVRCQRCAHERFICRKSSRFLVSRLPDDLKLSQATRLFRCVACNHNIVALTPENPYRASVGLVEDPRADGRNKTPYRTRVTNPLISSAGQDRDGGGVARRHMCE